MPSAIFEQAANSQLIQATTSGAAVEVTAAQLDTYVGVKQVRVFNSGTVAVSIGEGVSSAAAITSATIPTAGTPQPGVVIAPGATEVFTVGRFPQWIAARTLSGTADVYITPGLGG